MYIIRVRIKSRLFKTKETVEAVEELEVSEIA
jgi:hypothetical protein